MRPSESRRAGSRAWLRSSSASSPRASGSSRCERQLPGEPDRLAGEVDPVRVPGRVDQVEHAQHDGEVAGLVQPASPQSALAAADPLRHRRLRHVERVGDLAGREAADRAQGQRHLAWRARGPGGSSRTAGTGCRRPPRRRRAAARRASPPRGGDGPTRCGGHRRAVAWRPSSATHVGRRASARARPAAPRAAPPAAHPRRRRSPRHAGSGRRAPGGRGRAARPRPQPRLPGHLRRPTAPRT